MDVIDAVRQSGSIALQVTGDASVDWIEGESVVRVDDPPEGRARDDAVAWFEYSEQPCSLGLRIAEKITRFRMRCDRQADNLRPARDPAKGAEHDRFV